MKHTKTIIEPAYSREITEFITCDLCKEKIENSVYKIDEVIIERKTGESWPEGGHGEEMKIDICGKCFDTKFILWLNSQNFDPTWKEWSW